MFVEALLEPKSYRPHPLGAPPSMRRRMFEHAYHVTARRVGS